MLAIKYAKVDKNTDIKSFDTKIFVYPQTKLNKNIDTKKFVNSEI